MRVLLAGGGTGGHIYPALAVAEKLKTLHPECEILYIGTKKGLENKIVPKRGIPFRSIAVEGLPRKLNPAFFKAVGKAAGGCIEAKKIVKQFAPGSCYRDWWLCLRTRCTGSQIIGCSGYDS